VSAYESAFENKDATAKIKQLIWEDFGYKKKKGKILMRNSFVGSALQCVRSFQSASQSPEPT